MLPVALVSKMTLGLPTILVIQLIYPTVYEYQSFLCNLGAKTYTIFNPDCLELQQMNSSNIELFFSSMFNRTCQNDSGSCFFG